MFMFKGVSETLQNISSLNVGANLPPDEGLEAERARVNDAASSLDEVQRLAKAYAISAVETT